MSEPEVRLPTWVALAKLAEHARQNRSTVRLEPVNTYADLAWTYEVRVDQSPYLLPESREDELAYAERMILLWGERAAQLERDGAHHVPPLIPEALRRQCFACGVGAHARCRPIHAGERESGNWVHPIREIAATPDMDPGNPRALKVAAEVIDQRGPVIEWLQGHLRPCP